MKTASLLKYYLINSVKLSLNEDSFTFKYHLINSVKESLNEDNFTFKVLPDKLSQSVS